MSPVGYRQGARYRAVDRSWDGAPNTRLLETKDTKGTWIRTIAWKWSE